VKEHRINRTSEIHKEVLGCGLLASRSEESLAKKKLKFTDLVKYDN
jgi:hypothetical protein